MYPDLFGINNFSYSLMMFLGVLSALGIASFYFYKRKISKNALIDLLICSFLSIAGGIVFSILFENLFEFIALKDLYNWNFRMTFLGGLLGGIVTFLLVYFTICKKSELKILDVLNIAPISITFAHGLGRIGCFLAGCCYGKETNSSIGIDFPNDKFGKVIPTQLIEALFLFVLCIILILLLCKSFRFNASLYLVLYGIFRFVLEFYRGDERGVAFALSPSQIISLLLVFSSVPLFVYIRKINLLNYETK